MDFILKHEEEEEEEEENLIIKKKSYSIEVLSCVIQFAVGNVKTSTTGFSVMSVII